MIDETALLSTLAGLAAGVRDGTVRRHAVLLDLSGILHIDEPVLHRTLVRALAADGKGSATAQAFELPHNRLVLLVDSARLQDHQAVVAGVADLLIRHRRGLLTQRWFDLAEGIEPLSGHIQELSAAQVSSDRPAALAPGDDLARFLVIERSLHAADLSSLVRESLVWRLAPGEEPHALFSELTVSLAELERLFEVPLLRSPALLARVTELLDRRMLYLLMRDRDEHPLPVAVKLHADTVAGHEFAKIAGAFPARRHGQLICEVPWLEWKLAPDRVNRAIAAARRHDMRIALDHVPPTALDPAGLPAVDFLRIPFVDGNGERLDLPAAGGLLAALGAERCVISRCHDADAVRLVREAGFVLLQGQAVGAVAREMAPEGMIDGPAAQGTSARTGGAGPQEPEAPAPRSGWLARLFGRGAVPEAKPEPPRRDPGAPR